MESEKDDFKLIYAELKKTYVEQLPSKIESMGELISQIKEKRITAEYLDKLTREFHSIAGTSGTFGFTEITESAKILELITRKWLEKSKFPDVDDEDLTRLCDEFENLKKSFSLILSTRGSVIDESLVESIPDGRRTGKSVIRVIYILDDDISTLEHITSQVSLYGYEVHSFSDAELFYNAVLEKPPDAVIVDVVFPGDNLGGIHCISSISKKLDIILPVIFLSVRNDFEARLEAVRAGGNAYVEKPYDITNIIDKLDELTLVLKEDPYRVLIVEDDQFLASYYELILNQVGITTSIVSKPDLLIGTLRNFYPDLILLDIYMPWCNGMEMAKIIRQMNEFVAIPIVYLTSETNPDRRMIAMGFGADDYLTKPIQPNHLVTAVLMRVRRHRILKAHMIQDSLTGLLNHARLEYELMREIPRSERYDMDFTFAIIDIDHFKHVNDTHGHQTGDEVIKSLSRMLKQRLRETDIIGRIGGEEFGIILPGTGSNQAFKVMDELRSHFSKLEHQNRKREIFFLTFSCGIAIWKPGLNNTQLHSLADNALYAAKNKGRNNVHIE